MSLIVQSSLSNEKFMSFLVSFIVVYEMTLSSLIMQSSISNEKCMSFSVIYSCL